LWHISRWLKGYNIGASGNQDIGTSEIGVRLGLGLGYAWVALGWPKRGPRATQASRKGQKEEMLCLQQQVEKGRGGGEKDRVIARGRP
jgi:hypothetical protein